MSVVVYDGGATTVQYEGVAREVTDQNELARRQEVHFAKLPKARRFATKEGQVYVLIRPTWVRLMVHDGVTPVEEIVFDGRSSE